MHRSLTARLPLTCAAVAALAIALAGCGGSPATDTGRTPDTSPVATAEPTVEEEVVAELPEVTPEAEPTPEPEPTPSETEEVPASEFGEQQFSTRGNLIKELGQLAGTTSGDTGVTLSRFAVTDLVIDFECTGEWADPPANGHYLGIHLNVETTPELAAEDYPELYFSPYDWLAFDADGKRLNDPVGNSYSCLADADELPSSIGPGQSVSGWMVLDVADPTGIVVLTMGASNGWEWVY